MYGAGFFLLFKLETENVAKFSSRNIHKIGAISIGLTPTFCPKLNRPQPFFSSLNERNVTQWIKYILTVLKLNFWKFLVILCHDPPLVPKFLQFELFWTHLYTKLLSLLRLFIFKCHRTDEKCKKSSRNISKIFNFRVEFQPLFLNFY